MLQLLGLGLTYQDIDLLSESEATYLLAAHYAINEKRNETQEAQQRSAQSMNIQRSKMRR